MLQTTRTARHVQTRILSSGARFSSQRAPGPLGLSRYSPKVVSSYSGVLADTPALVAARTGGGPLSLRRHNPPAAASVSARKETQSSTKPRASKGPLGLRYYNEDLDTRVQATSAASKPFDRHIVPVSPVADPLEGPAPLSLRAYNAPQIHATHNVNTQAAAFMFAQLVSARNQAEGHLEDY